MTMSFAGRIRVEYVPHQNMWVVKVDGIQVHKAPIQTDAELFAAKVLLGQQSPPTRSRNKQQRHGSNKFLRQQTGSI
jgi:hypothetical protein